MGEIPESSTPSPAAFRPTPAREDCWSEDATFTLIEAWGQRYLDLNRGNLRQKQWQEVADAVNSRHGHIKKARRTDVQCKNRIDTLKKKYKIEKSKFLDSNGGYNSPWPFFRPLDHLIGSTIPLKKQLPPFGSGSGPGSPPMAVPIKRATPSPSPAVGVGGVTSYKTEEVGFRRNYSAMAAAAAAVVESEEEEEEEEEEESEEEDEEVSEEREGGGAEGIRELAKVIERFGEVYARVEAEKQRQMIELEKQRMQFAKELECQRMQMLVEMQVQLEKIKRQKRSHSNDMYS